MLKISATQIIRHLRLRAIFLAFLFILGTSSASAAINVTYFHNDISGSPMLATDAAGKVVWKESYKPYSEKLRNEPPSRDGKNKIGYAGSPFDANTGLSYMGARYYDPVIGRFMGVDPVGFQEANIHSFNRYAYGNNNPYKFVDRDGRHPLLAIALFTLAAHEFADTGIPSFGAGVARPMVKIVEGPAVKEGAVILEGKIFRSASGTSSSMTPRPIKDANGLSAANSLENSLPGKQQIIDTSKLKELCAVCDNAKTGHISIAPKDKSLMKEWMDSRGGEIHRLTQELKDAVIGTVNK
jgi:RHS repeat-associated protein